MLIAVISSRCRRTDTRAHTQCRPLSVSLPLRFTRTLHVNNNLRLINKWLRQTAQPYTRYTTFNSLPRRAAMTRHTDRHAGQQQQPGLAQRV